jgi:uncharacterized membrane protein
MTEKRRVRLELEVMAGSDRDPDEWAAALARRLDAVIAHEAPDAVVRVIDAEAME